MSRLPLAACAALVVLSGCAVPSTVDRDLARAQHADSLGHDWTAYRLYRAAAHGGSLEAQLRLATSRERLPGPSAGTRFVSESAALFSPVPGPRESARWAVEARATAERLAAAGDAQGHEVLGRFGYYGLDLSTSTGDEVSLEAYADARRHYEAAIALGSKRATRELAMIVWFQEGLIASEPYYRQSYNAGNCEDGRMLAMIALSRPYLARGLHPRDVAGDLSQMDYVASHRVMRSLPDPASQHLADEEVRGLRERARAGNAESDSLLRAIGAAGLLEARG